MSHEDCDRVGFRERPPVERPVVQAANLRAEFLVQLVEELLESLADLPCPCFIHAGSYLLRNAVFEVPSQQ